MSLISGSYSRGCGGGGAPDCRGDMVENCLRAGVEVAVRGEARAAVKVERGARGARDLAGKGSRRLMFLLDAVRMLRWMADIVNQSINYCKESISSKESPTPRKNM